MSNVGTLINLWCIVRENRCVFKITIGAGNDLFDLRKAILKELPAENVKAIQLSLWEINVVQSVLQYKDTRIDDYLNEVLEEQAATVGDTFHNVEGTNIRVVVGITAMNIGLVFVFINNTNNISKQCKKKVIQSERVHVFIEKISIDYGQLLKFVLNGRKMGGDLVITGFYPHMDDTLYSYLRSIGFKASKFTNEEEKVGEIIASMGDVMEQHKIPGTIILLADNGSDYGPKIRRALSRGWIVEIWFWKEEDLLKSSQMTPHIKEINLPDFPELKTIYINLDPFYKNFMHPYGYSDNKDVMMTYYVKMDLFCAWCRFSNNSLRLYCNTFDDWEAIKSYMKKKYPQAQEIIGEG